MLGALEKALLFLVVLLAPAQLGRHFWPDWSLVNGVRVDYLAPTLYLTDLLIIGLFLLSRLRVRVPPVIISFAVLNVLVAQFPLLAIYKWFRVLEYFWLFKYLVQKKLALSPWPLVLAIFWTSLLAWWQLLKQASAGGWWYWLGERTFDITTPGIAKIFLGFGIWDLGFVLRPYATLPHPNALAGWLLVAGLIVYYLNSLAQKRLPIGRWSLVIVGLTIPVTFSRTAIFLEIFLLATWLLAKLSSQGLKFLVLVVAAGGLVGGLGLPGSPESLPQRLALNRLAAGAIKQSPWWGVGWGNFIPVVASQVRQPVHNIFLLLVAELGLPASVVWGWWLILTVRKLQKTRNWILTAATAVVILTGLVDHYWLTLPQNSLLLSILLSLVWGGLIKR